MMTERSSSILLPTSHVSQVYADVGPPIASNKNEQLPPPPDYTTVEIPLKVNDADTLKSLIDEGLQNAKQRNSEFCKRSRNP